MRFSNSLVASVLAVGSLVSAAPAESAKPRDKRSLVERDGVTYNVFEHAATGARLEYVNNSGICETTPGVNQYSGYLSVGTNMSMWFWFFEARNNSATAPLATWFNGGPGCSSMIGLFQENGPCQFYNGDSEPSLNPYSFNNYANMLYIDQPIGVGFSYGTDDVTSTETAAPYVWKLIQAFYAQFPQYENRDFGIFTESYGGHYGPEFADYFQEQNAAIESGTTEGEAINLVALGINNGWYDSKIQYKAYIEFSANNSYKEIISDSEYTEYINTYNEDCAPAVDSCYSSGTNSACENADDVCYADIENALISEADFDVYDIREPSNDPNPPETYVTYLRSSAVVKAIGAQTTYQECPNAPYNKFQTTGDGIRSFLDELSDVVSSGSVTTLIWAGDADWICNWIGGLEVANAVEYDGQSTFASQSLEPYTVNGEEKGSFKTEGKLSFLRVYGAGHEVPFYTPEIALQAFIQTMQQEAISST